MRIKIRAGGKSRGGPEAALTDDYLARARPLGRALGIAAIDLDEVPDTKRGHDLFLQGLKPGAFVIACDERGTDLTSKALADRLSAQTGAGTSELAILIGAADGLPLEVKRAARETWAFGRATWPHLLLRAMLAEQIYRALTLLSGHPYHRP